ALVLAFGEILWIQFSKNKEIDFSKKHDLNQLVMRYFLAFIFFSYGIAKIIDEQFGSPYHILDRRMSEVPAFSLAWRFFDYSYFYKLFIGLGQVIASTLFLSRRTSTLGAIILLPIIGNIVFVNFAFRVPVTYYSFCYLVFTVYLLLCDFDRLYA